MTTYLWGTLFTIAILERNLFNRYEKYMPLHDWNLRQNAYDDFDGDGKKDYIILPGCAFLSSFDATKVPKNQQCIAPGYAIMVFKNQNIVGQKYVSTREYNLGSVDPHKVQISHSYLMKKPNENWKIYLDTNGSLKIFEIVKGGSLREVNEIPIEFRMDENLYLFSGYNFFTLFKTLGNVSFLLLFISPLLTTIAAVAYFLVKKFNIFS
jgi:hypothetical protein